MPWHLVSAACRGGARCLSQTALYSLRFQSQDTRRLKAGSARESMQAPEAFAVVVEGRVARVAARPGAGVLSGAPSAKRLGDGQGDTSRGHLKLLPRRDGQGETSR